MDAHKPSAIAGVDYQPETYIQQGRGSEVELIEGQTF